MGAGARSATVRTSGTGMSSSTKSRQPLISACRLPFCDC